jgi:hypothetical protein
VKLPASGGIVDGDAVAASVELVDKRARVLFGSEAVEPVATEVVVGHAVAHDVERSNEDGVADRLGCLGWAAPAAESAVLRGVPASSAPANWLQAS